MQVYKKCWTLCFQQLNIHKVISQNLTGQLNNRFYKQIDYYGARDKEYLIVNTTLTDDITLVRWALNFDYNEAKTKTYFAASAQSSILEFVPDTSGSEYGTFNLIAGVSFSFNYLDSKLLSSQFNAPKSILYYFYSGVRNWQATNQVVGVDLGNSGCSNNPDIFDSNCACNSQSLDTGVTSCEDYLWYQLDSTSRILQYFPTDTSSVTDTTVIQDRLIVADTDNHCVKAVNLLDNSVQTIAGVCTTSGFKDGPLGNNLQNSPSSLGIDMLGNIWIYDYGNRYIRFLNFTTNGDWSTGQMYTMIKGVCRDLPTDLNDIIDAGDSRFNYDNKFKYSLCYRKWIKTDTKDPQYFNYTEYDTFCSLHYSECQAFLDSNNPLYTGAETYCNYTESC